MGREELEPEKLERKEPVELSCESEEEEMIRKNRAGEVGWSDGEKEEEKRRKQLKKQEKKKMKQQAEHEKKMKEAKKDKKAEKKAKKEKKAKQEKRAKKKRRKSKESSSSESDLDEGIELSGSKKKVKKSGKAPNVTIPLDLSQLRTMMSENLITDKEFRKLMKATVKSEKEKKVTFKISEFSRNSGQELMKVLFSKKSSGERKRAKKENVRETSSSSPEPESKESKKRE